MKKIAIVTIKMVAGGIEKSLISLLESIPKDEYDVTLFVTSYGGEFEKYIPEWVNIKCIFGKEKTSLEKILNKVKKCEYSNAIKILVYTYLYRREKSGYKQDSYYLNMIDDQAEEYDVAISYHVPASFPVRYVVEKINAKNRIAWIHSDVSQYTNELRRYDEYYKKFNKIVCVSKYAKNEFIKMYPKLSEKTHLFYNIISENEIYKMSKLGEGFTDGFDGKRILTVGRLTNQKGQDIIPTILSKLLIEGYNVKWYCIGDGDYKELLKEKIEQCNLDKKLILLGTKTNPYPYFSQCDFYVQPSRHEGYCITLAEARAFNKPIITTDFVGAREQIKDGETGYIVDFDVDKIYEGIKKLLEDKSLCSKFSDMLSKESVDTSLDIDKLFSKD